MAIMESLALSQLQMNFVIEVTQNLGGWFLILLVRKHKPEFQKS